MSRSASGWGWDCEREWDEASAWVSAVVRLMGLETARRFVTDETCAETVR